MAVSTDPQQQRRSNLDALRSLARFISEVLPGYDVFLAPDQADDRPSAVVRLLDGRTAQVVAHTARITQPFAVYVYPVQAADPQAGEVAAFALADTLERAFEVGLQGLSYANRVPMWDWSGTPMDQTMAPADDVILDYYVVESFTTRPLPDPDEPRRWSISSTLRLVWARHPGVQSAPTATTVSVAPAPGGLS